MKQSAPYAVLGLGVLLMGLIAWWFGFRTTPEVEAPLPEVPAIELSEGLSIYTNGEEGFLVAYPEGAVVAETFDTKRLPNAWSVNARVDSPGVPLVSITTYHVQSETTYPRDYTVLLRIGKSTDAKDVSECLKARDSEVAGPQKVLGDTTFSSYPFGDAAMMQYVKGVSYRAVHSDACWAIEAITTGSAYRDEPQSADISDGALAAEYARLDAVVDSFRFVR